MMVAEVLFISNMEHLYEARVGNRRIARNEYLYVCTMDVDSAEDAWRVCQNVDTSWYTNPQWAGVRVDDFSVSEWAGRIARADGGLRSMMVGDIVHINGRYLMCDSVGWQEVELDEDTFCW
jgi:hypothetical protein